MNHEPECQSQSIMKVARGVSVIMGWICLEVESPLGREFATVHLGCNFTGTGVKVNRAEEAPHPEMWTANARVNLWPEKSLISLVVSTVGALCISQWKLTLPYQGIFPQGMAASGNITCPSSI